MKHPVKLICDTLRLNGKYYRFVDISKNRRKNIADKQRKIINDEV